MAVKATWDDTESNSEEEVDVTNVCFIARGDSSNKVSSELNLDDSELSMDERAMAFEELQSKYDLLRVKNAKLRKENEALTFSLNKIEKDFDLTKLHAKVKTLRL